MADSLPEDWISAYLDGQLSESELRLAEERLAADAAAARRLEEYRALQNLLAGLPPEQIGEDLTPGVLRQAERLLLERPSEARDQHSDRSRRPVIWSLLAVAAALLLWVTTTEVQRDRGDREVAQAPQPQFDVEEHSEEFDDALPDGEAGAPMSRAFSLREARPAADAREELNELAAAPPNAAPEERSSTLTREDASQDALGRGLSLDSLAEGTGKRELERLDQTGLPLLQCKLTPAAWNSGNLERLFQQHGLSPRRSRGAPPPEVAEQALAKQAEIAADSVVYLLQADRATLDSLITAMEEQTDDVVDLQLRAYPAASDREAKRDSPQDATDASPNSTQRQHLYRRLQAGAAGEKEMQTWSIPSADPQLLQVICVVRQAETPPAPPDDDD